MGLQMGLGIVGLYAEVKIWIMAHIAMRKQSVIMSGMLSIMNAVVREGLQVGKIL